MLWLTTIIHNGTAKIKIRDLPTTTTTTQKGRTTDKRYRSSIKRANNRKKMHKIYYVKVPTERTQNVCTQKERRFHQVLGVVGICVSACSTMPT